MGSCGGDDDGKTSSVEGNRYMDVECGDTLPFDSQLSPISSSGGEVGDDNVWQYLENTLRFDDDDDDDALETQPVNLAGETQVLSIAGETQVLDGIDGDEDINTQLLDVIDEEVHIDCHGDRMDTTEVLENVNELSSDYPRCAVNAQSADPKEISCEPFCGLCEKKLSGKTNDVINEQMSSGSMPPRFTFLRVESLREAALSAHNMDLKQAKSEANSIKGTNQSQEPLSLKDEETSLGCTEKTREIDLEYYHGEYSGKVEGIFNKNKSKVASSAVRKLFIDEKEGCSLNSHDVNRGEGLNKVSFYDDELAGLSYVNSQEPGELSQANALDFVDRLLKDNFMEFDKEAYNVKNVQEDSNFLPSLKGQQTLAQRATGSGKAGNAGIYDWDDSREDEGGGDILRRRKEELLEGETHGWKSLPGVQKSKVSRPNGNYRNVEEKVSVDSKRTSVVQSDSRLVLHNRKVRDGSAKEAAKKSRRNIINDLDEQFNINSSRVQLEPDATAADAQRTFDVGLDTQIAAEAMEALGNCEDIDNHVANEATRSVLTDEPSNSSAGTMGTITTKECSGQYYRNWKVRTDLQKSSLSRKRTKETREHCKKDNLLKRSKRSLLNVEDNLISGAIENSSKLPSHVIERSKSAGASKRHKGDELDNCNGRERGNGGSLVNKRHLQSQVCHSTPVASRTRRSLVANQLVKSDRLSRSLREGDGRVRSQGERSSSSGIQVSKALDPLPTLSCSDHRVVDENSKFSRLEKSASKLSADNNGAKNNILDCPRRRSLRNYKGSEELVSSSHLYVQSEDFGSSVAGKRKTRTDTRSVVRSHVSRCIQEEMSELNLEQGNLNSKEKNDAAGLISARSSDITGSDESPRERSKSSNLASATPDNCKTSVNDASPVCMDVNFYKQTCNRELLRELRSLSDSGLEYATPSKDLRKRRDMTDVRILYSQHLDKDIIKHQKKILARLGFSVATSIMDATHFIADSFMRTRNMLEAITSGKPVVTHLWIESCGQTSCFIDEKNYILRDAKKEKEFGFSMPVSLARAVRRPLLEGRRVLITPNTKPSKEIISKLVKAVQGQAVERIGRSSLKDDKIQDDLLILSCEEDYASCVPFLEKGAAVYSSELLLNGIVTQKLEYERHQLFADHVKKTRSSIWLKGDGGTFRPVTKCK